MASIADTILADIKAHPEQHVHFDLEELQACCMIEGAIHLLLVDAHGMYVNLGTNNGERCDVITGQCACGSTHGIGH